VFKKIIKVKKQRKRVQFFLFSQENAGRANSERFSISSEVSISKKKSSTMRIWLRFRLDQFILNKTLSNDGT
jgi:hypothetical protein